MKASVDNIISLEKINQWADFWYYDKGFNVFPADIVNRKPLVNWKQWPNISIPERLYLKWKEIGSFDKGIAIIPRFLIEERIKDYILY
jgi:hypothetical protein